jgi:hypothetical protein
MCSRGDSTDVLVDLNRAGCALLEIVTAPDLSGGEVQMVGFGCILALICRCSKLRRLSVGCGKSCDDCVCAMATWKRDRCVWMQMSAFGVLWAGRARLYTRLVTHALPRHTARRMDLCAWSAAKSRTSPASSSCGMLWTRKSGVKSLRWCVDGNLLSTDRCVHVVAADRNVVSLYCGRRACLTRSEVRPSVCGPRKKAPSIDTCRSLICLLWRLTMQGELLVSMVQVTVDQHITCGQNCCRSGGH